MYSLMATVLLMGRSLGAGTGYAENGEGGPGTNWTAAEKLKGYVVFEYSTLENLPPAHVPTREAIVDTVSCALARDEYESIQFGVHALADSLTNIRVTVVSDLEVTVYHRIDPGIKQQLASEPAELDEIARWVPSQIHLQRGDVYEKLPAGQSVNFWLTFRADGETPEGLHLGNIRIEAAGRRGTVLGLEVKVRPFQLQRPRVPFGVYFREDMLPKRFGGLATPKESVLAMYRDMAEHGHNSSWFYPLGSFSDLPPRNNYALDKLIPLAQKAGLLDPEVPSLIAGGIPGGLNDEELKAAAAWLEAERTQRGWPELIVFGTDEPSYPRDYDAVSRELRNLRGFPMRVVVDLSGTSAYGYGGDLCDIQNVMDGMISPEMLDEARRVGTEIWTYSYRIWREHFYPFSQRYFAGLYTWTYQLGGNWVWAYHHGHHRHVWFTPESHEPMPVTAWEARREGIDDYRYLQMVEDCVAANPDETLAIEASAWLQALRVRLSATVPNEVEVGKPLELDEYDQIRARAADYIQRLGPVSNEAVARPPISHAKDEAASYRGKSVRQCIAGLASSDVSERRAAAWALFELGPKAAQAAEPLARLLDDPEVRIPALHALEHIGPEAFRVVPEIVRLLNHPDFYVRVGAVLALGEIGCPLDKRDRSGRRSPSEWAAIVAEPLMVAYRDDNASLSYLAAGMLSVIGGFARPALPEAITMLDDPSHTRQSAAIGLITGLGPDAAATVPKLIEMHKNKSEDIRYINALAAIGPAAKSAIPALEEYAAKEDSGPNRADSYYALFCIRNEISDLRKMVELLKDANENTDTKKHVVKLLNQLGAKAAPVGDEVNQMLKSGEFSDWEEDLQSLLEKVETGEVPGVSFRW